MSSLLHLATSVAFKAHEGQSDKQGQPYIAHVMRVALAMETDEERAVALLHDVVEDTAWSHLDLALENIPPAVLDAVVALTRNKVHGETYTDYIARVASNPLACRVKLADLADNLRPERISLLPPEQAASLSKRYHAAYRYLLGGGVEDET